MAPKSTHGLDQPNNEPVSSQNGVKPTSKRRKLNSEHDDLELPSRAVDRQRSQLEDEIEHGTKILHRALKLARGFERQKLGRRQKAAKEKKDGVESARLEAEVAALKGLDLSVVAETHLHKTLLKTKSIASAPAFPPRIAAGIQHAGHSGNVATVNVTARLYNSNPVKPAMTETLYRIRTILGLDSTGPTFKSNKKKGSLMLENGRSEVPRELRGPLDGKARSDIGAGARTSLSPEWTGFSDDHKVAFASSDDQELDLSMYDARLAGSSDSDSEDDISPQTHPNIVYPQSADVPTFRSSSLSASSRSPPPKIRKPDGPPSAPNSTFIPSLMGGYWSGSESADGDDTSERNARKNRMGQQARRLLWEKKFGKKANHLKRKERDEGWDSRKGAGGSAGRERRGRGRGRGHDRARGRSYGSRNEGHGSGANSDPVASRSGGKKDDAPLHPSWEAAKKAKEQKKNVAFQGKKVVFD